MAEEIEIKLALPPQALQAVAAAAWLRTALAGPVLCKALRSVYFDSAGLKLKEAGLTLRLRHSGKSCVQTVKAEAQGIFTRLEWEGAIAGPLPELEALPSEARQRLELIGLPLAAVFETAVERTILPLFWEGAGIEMALDHGAITAADHKALISEIEIELKAGPQKALTSLARRLAEHFPVRLDLRAKSSRGYALLQTAGAMPVYAGALRLPDGTMPQQRVMAIAMHGLRHCTANSEAVLAGLADGLAQMRAGLRRLRAAMTLFQPFRDEDGYLALQRDLKDLAKRLAAGMGSAQAAVESERYRLVMLAVAFWLADQGPREA